MNTKQAPPIAVTVAPAFAAVPPLLLIGGLVALAAWLLSGDDKQKPEKESQKPIFPRPPVSNSLNPCRNSGQKSFIPAKSAGKITVSPPLSAFPANSVPTVQENKTQSPPKKVIIQENMAKIFNHGRRNLDRKAAVAALMALGFGKSAAYEALSPDGRFSAFLFCAPEGTITWKVDSKFALCPGFSGQH